MDVISETQDVVKLTCAIKRATKAKKEYNSIQKSGLAADRYSEQIVLDALGGSGT